MVMTWEEIAEARMREISRLRSVVRECNGIIDRKNALLFQVIQYAREQADQKFDEWKDADDWLFSNLDITKDELAEIYDGKGVMVYAGPCKDESEPSNGQHPAGQDSQTF